jgi:hypothetical protein
MPHLVDKERRELGEKRREKRDAVAVQHNCEKMLSQQIWQTL